MKKKLFILLIFFWAIPSGFAQLKTYSFKEAEQLALKNPKPFVIFIHTSWCKFCKMMENSTFKNAHITAKLNDSFYFIALDAEDKKDITFNHHNFEYKPTGANTGIHELTTALATINNQVIYPTLTILGPDYSILFQQASYLKAQDLLMVLEKMK